MTGVYLLAGSGLGSLILLLLGLMAFDAADSGTSIWTQFALAFREIGRGLMVILHTFVPRRKIAPAPEDFRIANAREAYARGSIDLPELERRLDVVLGGKVEPTNLHQVIAGYSGPVVRDALWEQGSRSGNPATMTVSELALANVQKLRGEETA